jgi:uncharacterized protein (DUF697 family)
MINSAALSKINWTQAISFIAMIGAVFGMDISPEVQVQILAGVTAVQTLLTVVFRTFFTAK